MYVKWRKHGTSASDHSLTMKRNDFDKRITIAIITVIIIVMTQLFVNQPKTIIDAETPLEAPLAMLDKKTVDFTPEPQKPVLEPPKPPEPPKPAPVATPAGDWVTRCKKWAKMAGIPLNDSAITLLDRESNCDPTARNPSSSAGGIPQALPWTKMGCNLSWSDADAICQLKWFYGYVIARYGSYESALAHSYALNWY